MQTVMPTAKRERILTMMHNDVTAGNFSAEKVLGKMVQLYYWYRMRSEIERHCTSCIECQKRKPPHHLPMAPMKSVDVKGFMDRIAMDICGPYPVSDRGNKYTLVVTEYLTKWPEVSPIPNQEAETVPLCLEDYTSRHGISASLLTDQGRNFESETIQTVCRLYGIRKCLRRPTFLRPTARPNDSIEH